VTPTERLIALYSRATAKQREEGREWYPGAYLASCEAGYALRRAPDGLVWSPAECCAVAAALSPRIAWEHVLVRLAHIRRTGDIVGHTKQTLRTVERVLSSPPSDWDGVCGPKVNAFRRALLGDESSAVCDVHMFRAMGLPDTVGHERGAEVIRRAAHRVCEPVTSFQATVWVVQRGYA
jgi:hypothetical protein